MEHRVKNFARRGFTMVELIIAMGILITIISISIPNFNRFSTASASDNAASLLYSDMIAQRERALSICLDTGIVLNPTVNDGSYYLWETDWNDPAHLRRITTKRVKLSQITGRKITFSYPCG